MTYEFNTYEEIDNLVLLYQSDNKELSAKAAEALLKAFHPFIIKYYNLLNGNGFINLREKDTKKFVALFIDDNEIRKALHSGRMNQEQKKYVYRNFNNIIQTCKSLEGDEIIHELSIIILTLARRYKNKDKNFTVYLNSVFHYELSRRIKQIMQEPLVFQSQYVLPFHEYKFIDEEEESEEELVEQIDNTLIEDDCDLNYSWIRGITCSELFRELTPIQRLIIKYYYGDGLTDKEIGERLGYVRETVCLKRLAAVRFLKEELSSNAEYKM
jgi:RNA polymerase sigma factor (sigma-70 family)